MPCILSRRRFICSTGLMAGGLLLGLSGLAFAQDAPADDTLEVTQDDTAIAYQKTVEAHVAQNERMVHLSITNQGDQVCYKATWSKTDGPPWYGRHGLTDTIFQQQLDNYTEEGYRPIELCAYMLGSSPYFGGLWELTDGPNWKVEKDLSPDDFSTEDKNLTGLGYHLVQACHYGTEAKPLVLGLWQK